MVISTGYPAQYHPGQFPKLPPELPAWEKYLLGSVPVGAPGNQLLKRVNSLAKVVMIGTYQGE